jgi:hypothetical protein
MLSVLIAISAPTMLSTSSGQRMIVEIDRGALRIRQPSACPSIVIKATNTTELTSTVVGGWTDEST